MSAASLADRLDGVRVIHVEALSEPLKWVVVFERRGTDEDSGYMIVEGDDVHFDDGGDPDAWTKLVADRG